MKTDYTAAVAALKARDPNTMARTIDQRSRAADKTLQDRIEPGVQVLFVGINPGIRSALTGHHFAGFSNRFWKLLFDARLVPEPITYRDDGRLPEWGYGITNIVPRATPGIDDLAPAEFAAGAEILLAKIRQHRPAIVAVVGVTVWRALLTTLGHPDARKRPIALGFQRRSTVARRGCPPEISPQVRFFVLPNPSGRNANYSYAEMLAAFRALRRAVRSHRTKN